MAEIPPKKSKRREMAVSLENQPDRFPTNAELLADLSQPGAKPGKSRKQPAVSRRTRDFLLVVGFTSACLILAIVEFMGKADAWTIVRMALTGIGVSCALLWYIFFGVMSRY